jgi:hypothetical protein
MPGGGPHTWTHGSPIVAERTQWEASPMSQTTTPRPPASARHGFTLPTVRELPPVARPGMFDATW